MTVIPDGRRVVILSTPGYGPGTGTMVLTWDLDPNPSVTDYRVELGSATGLSDRGTVLTGSAIAGTYQLTTLTGTYYVRVRSMIGATPSALALNEVVITI